MIEPKLKTDYSDPNKTVALANYLDRLDAELHEHVRQIGIERLIQCVANTISNYDDYLSDELMNLLALDEE